MAHTDRVQDQSRTVTRSAGRSVDWSVIIDNQLADEDVMQISGAGHWFLEGWIGDHAVDFLVDSAVTAMSCSFYKNLVEARAPVGDSLWSGSYVAPMVHRLTFWDAHLVWSHS